MGTELKLSIADGVNACEVRGKVIHKNAGGGLGVVGMGVVFREIGAEQNSTIDSWLRNLSGAGAEVEAPAAATLPAAVEMPAEVVVAAAFSDRGQVEGCDRKLGRIPG